VRKLQTDGVLKSLFGKVHAFLANRLGIRWIVAILTRVSLVCTLRSWSLLKRRFRINQEKVRSTIHRLGNTSNL
jgi:hypothetical protein